MTMMTATSMTTTIKVDQTLSVRIRLRGNGVMSRGTESPVPMKRLLLTVRSAPRWIACLVAACLATPEYAWSQNATPPSPAASAAPNPEHETLKQNAENAYQNSDFPKCIELTSRVLGANPRDHVALYLRASARVELGQLQRNVKEVRAGVEDAREAIRHGGTDQFNYYLPYFYGMTGLAQLENRKEHAEVVVQFANALLSRPNARPEDQANLRYQRANAYLFLGQGENAAKDFEAAVALVPTHLGARLGLADTFVRMRQMDKAEAAFTAAVQSAPNNPLVFNNRGMFFQQSGQSAKAIADFTKAIELDPAFAVAVTNRGFSLMSEGNPQAAESDFSAAMKIDPKQPLVYSLRGTARLSQGNAAGAIEDYSQVLSFDAQNPVAAADLGFAKYFAGDFAGAATAFEQSLAADPNLKYLNPWLYWSLVKGGQKDLAAQKVAGVLKQDPAKLDWSDGLVRYLAGQASLDELMKLAESKDTPLRTAQLCESAYFTAEKLLVAGDANAATAEYQKALASKQTHLSAYRGSQYALKSFTPAAK
jgi:lipoprotein NlpI